MSITNLIADIKEKSYWSGDIGDSVIDLDMAIYLIELNTAGMVLVSREPTEAMCDAGGEWMHNEYPSLEFNDSYSIYKAMLSIAEEAE